MRCFSRKTPLPSSQAVTRHVYLQPKYTFSESWFWSRSSSPLPQKHHPLKLSKKCVPPSCPSLPQTGANPSTHFFHSLRGWRGVVRNSFQNQDSTKIQPSAMCTPWQILKVWPGFCATRAGDWSPKPGFRKCVLGLAPVCDRLVQDGGTHFLTA